MLSPERRAEIRRDSQARMLAELSGIEEFRDPTLLKPHPLRPTADAVRQRAAEVARMASTKSDKPQRDMEAVARQVVADFLAGVNRRQLNLRHGVPWTFINRAIEAGTSHAERHEVWKAGQRRRSKKDRDKNRAHTKKTTAIPVGQYGSIKEAALAMGLSQSWAQVLYRRGVPIGKWLGRTGRPVKEREFVIDRGMQRAG